MTDPIAIAVSGGVDSLVCAFLLKARYPDLFGLHFLTGYEDPAESIAAHVVSRFARMGIPVFVIDAAERFKHQVVDAFVTAYQNGLTPNPCLTCNAVIKFGVLLDEAEKRGASQLATGHYARMVNTADGRPSLRKGVDPGKDQSYFLSRLSPEKLARAVFPLGDRTKAEVRAVASKNSLIPLVARESQDICFIREGGYVRFLSEQAGIGFSQGDIVTTTGTCIGRHQGLHRYTIGQRRGINCPAGEAYYVLRLDVAQNRLVVGTKDQLTAPGCRVEAINWIVNPWMTGPWIADLPETGFQVSVRIRYRHQAVGATIVLTGSRSADIWFEAPQAAVTPGQGAVFYRDDEVLGGGWIAGPLYHGPAFSWNG